MRPARLIGCCRPSTLPACERPFVPARPGPNSKPNGPRGKHGTSHLFRPARAHRRPGEERSAASRQAPDQQGHGDARAGALAIPRRHPGGPAQGLPVRERHRQHRAPLRHAGSRGYPRLQQGNLQHRHRLQGRGHQEELGPRRAAAGRAGARPQSGVPGDRRRGGRPQRAGQGRRRTADPHLDARIRQRALRVVLDVHLQETPTPAARTSATTGRWSKARHAWA